MAQFKIVNGKDDITLSAKWVDSAVSTNNILDKKGKPVTSKYTGRKYRLIAKKERNYSRWERIGRIFLGCSVVGISLGIALCSKSVKNLFIMKKKTIDFGQLITSPPAKPPVNITKPKPEEKLQEPESESSEELQEPESESSSSSSSSETSLSSVSSEISNNIQNFFNAADTWSFLDGLLEEYRMAIFSDNPKWQTREALLFLHFELLGLEGEISKLNKETEEVSKALLSKKNDTKLAREVQELEGLKKNIGELTASYKEALVSLKTMLGTEPVTGKKVVGFKNVGNTCYINSCLQPLLAIRNFSEMVPKEIQKYEKESESNFMGRQKILKSFQEFLKSWNEGNSSKDLGKKIGALRKEIFEVKLQEGGFVNDDEERDFQDSGQFFELILHVLGRGFQLKVTAKPVLEDGTQIDHTRVETTSQGVFYLQQGLLNSKKNDLRSIQKMVDLRSVQKMVNEYREPAVIETEWRFKDPNTGQKIEVKKIAEKSKIVGRPQELMIVRVHQHPVDPDIDGLIDFSNLFEDEIPRNQAVYELVGFAQNHSQIHWTSVVNDGSQWKYCNDASVGTVDPQDSVFRYPANYLVYRRKP